MKIWMKGDSNQTDWIYLVLKATLNTSSTGFPIKDAQLMVKYQSRCLTLLYLPYRH